jgi:SulP family sulfate permease
MVDTAGGRSQWSHLTTAGVVLLVLLFLTRPLSFLPEAVLSAIVFLVGVRLVDHKGLAEIRRQKPREFALALVTAGTVVFLGVEAGILLAAVLSLLQHVRRSYQPHTAVVVHDADDGWRFEDAVPGRMTVPGLVMYWFGAELFYANVGFFSEEVRRLVNESPSPVRWLVIDSGAITGVDYSAGRALTELFQDLKDAGVVIALARAQLRTHGHLEQLGLKDLIGANHIFNSRHACLSTYEAASATGAQAASGQTAEP